MDKKQFTVSFKVVGTLSRILDASNERLAAEEAIRLYDEDPEAGWELEWETDGEPRVEES